MYLYVFLNKEIKILNKNKFLGFNLIIAFNSFKHTFFNISRLGTNRPMLNIYKLEYA